MPATTAGASIGGQALPLGIAHPKRIVVVGDTAVTTEGMAAIVGRDQRYQICGAANCHDKAFELLHLHRPDLLLVEPFLESHDPIRCIKELVMQFPQMRILIVSRHAEETYAERALHAGASGYFMKTGTAEELMHAIETVLAGETYVSMRIASIAVREFVGRATDAPNDLRVLTDRELHIFSLIGAGHGCGQIAQELGISRKTVETHCEHIKLKLGYADAAALKQGAQELMGPAA